MAKKLVKSRADRVGANTVVRVTVNENGRNVKYERTFEPAERGEITAWMQSLMAEDAEEQ